jgi:hypothetical protein
MRFSGHAMHTIWGQDGRNEGKHGHGVIIVIIVIIIVIIVIVQSGVRTGGGQEKYRHKVIIVIIIVIIVIVQSGVRTGGGQETYRHKVIIVIIIVIVRSGVRTHVHCHQARSLLMDVYHTCGIVSEPTQYVCHNDGIQGAGNRP